MKNKKGNRQSKSVKEIIIKARVDSLIRDRLEYCSRKMHCSKSEVIRLGINKIYADVNEVEE